MFDGLSAMDGVFIVGALLLGFGVVKFMLAQVQPPTPTTEAHDTPRERPPVPREDKLADVASQGAVRDVQAPGGPTAHGPDETPRKP